MQSAVARLVRVPIGVACAVRAAQDADAFVALIGLTALSRRETLNLPASTGERFTDWLVSNLSSCQAELEPLYFATLRRHATHPVIGSVLAKLDDVAVRASVAEFIRDRQHDGERVDVGTFEGRVPYGHAQLVKALIEEYGSLLGDEFQTAFEAWTLRLPIPSPAEESTPELLFDALELIQSFAQLWTPPFDQPRATVVGPRAEIVDRIVETLREGKRSVLLAGPSGVGKTRLIRAALDRVPERQPVFEAGAPQTYAGCIFVGELETKIDNIARGLAGTKALWVFPRLEEAISAGQHSRSPQGMLDALIPHLRAGEVTIIAEVSDAGLERLLSERPGVAAEFEVIRVRSLQLSETIEVARAWLAETSLSVTEETLAETFELALQFAPDSASPGNVLRLLNDAADDVLEQGRTSLEIDDVLRRISINTALPLSILDRHTPLDLEELRRFFDERILNQPEAVEVVVQRIAMVKAGLTDPNRPLAVLFFVGPTGTGKTELAKALAEYMFGSADRLIRLDMSEYVTAEGLERLLAPGSGTAVGTSLVSAVKRDPFAVVLLDEFEKAAPAVWDLFLQVFDDGRLTDRAGATVDFRRSVLILTSNAGSALATKAGVGFAADAHTFDRSRILETINRTFRPEFRNRIDRIVMFKPFERAEMRALLDKELVAALDRRGLRTQPWAIEVDESAYEFLIERGFTADLGARPLRRAIERHLLAPLATAIVGQGVPEGEQFLLVRAEDGRLTIAFVDPDEPAPGTTDGAEARSVESPLLHLKSLALSPETGGRAGSFLAGEARRIERAAQQLGLPERKADALRAVNSSGFWERPNRFRTLAEAQYLDRFDAALATARRLAERLSLHDHGRQGQLDERERVQRLALRLYILDCALAGLESGASAEVYVRLRRWRGARHGDVGDEANVMGMLESMYEQWSGARGMQMKTISDASDERIFVIGGLGCGQILERESGLHVFGPGRTEASRRSDHRSSIVQVCVVESVPGPDEAPEAILERARRSFDAVLCPTDPVRRYVTGSAPLVRDRSRGYRTGRLNDVLSGNFDLF